MDAAIFVIVMPRYDLAVTEMGQYSEHIVIAVYRGSPILILLVSYRQFGTWDIVFFISIYIVGGNWNAGNFWIFYTTFLCPANCRLTLKLNDEQVPILKVV